MRLCRRQTELCSLHWTYKRLSPSEVATQRPGADHDFHLTCPPASGKSPPSGSRDAGIHAWRKRRARLFQQTYNYYNYWMGFLLTQGSANFLWLRAVWASNKLAAGRTWSWVSGDPLATWCCLMSHAAVGVATAVAGVAYQIAVPCSLSHDHLLCVCEMPGNGPLHRWQRGPVIMLQLTGHRGLDRQILRAGYDPRAGLCQPLF